MQLTCDRCEQAFEVPNGQPGQKVACPSCGDINVIPGPVAVGTPVGATAPAPTTAAPRTDRAAESGYPPANGPEVDVMVVRPAMLGAHPIRFLLLTLALLGGIAGAIYWLVYLNPRHLPLGGTSAAIAIVALKVFIIWKVHTLSEGLRITTKRVIETKGLLSKATSEVRHADIKNVQVEQTFLDRVWNVGTLKLSSSGENEDPIEMRDMPNPAKVRDVIDLYRPL
ncbi:MAG TPA: PH domain-containing protein [Phycisphaerales bacterium]|nr:PH domain-containing protein [Phycisphaerales bacterium]